VEEGRRATLATLRPLLDEQADLRDGNGALPDDVAAALHRDAPFGLSSWHKLPDERRARADLGDGGEASGVADGRPTCPRIVHRSGGRSAETPAFQEWFDEREHVGRPGEGAEVVGVREEMGFDAVVGGVAQLRLGGARAAT
jgi:hypothetical protein